MVLKKSIIILLIATLYIYAGKQIALQNDKWELVGMSGLYVEGLTPPVWGANGFILSNTVNTDGNASYAFKETIKTGTREFEDFNATIGILGIRGAFSPTGDTELVLGVDVGIEKTDFNDYSPTKPKYRMYLAGRNDAPAIRVDYQADLEGQEFKVRFGTEDIYYKAFFNKENTYNSPQLLSPNALTINNTITSVKIIDVIDNNILDNPITDLISNSLGTALSNSEFTTGPVNIREANITVYRFNNNGKWNIYDSRNNIASNAFDKFEVGKGYWVKMTNSNYNAANRVHGIIIGDNGISDDSYNALRNGWNLLSFRDSDIRYSPTAMFIPRGAYDGTSINISYKFDLHRFALTVTGFTGSNVDLEASRRVNWESESFRYKRGGVMKLRAFPARKSISETSMQDGIVIISNDLFETNSADAISLAGLPLVSKYYLNHQSTYFGEFFLAARIGDLNGSDINETFKVDMPLYNPNTISITDLNDSDLVRKSNKIREGFISAGNHPKASEPDANSSVYMINIDMDSAHSYETHLFAATARFSLFDSTYSKVFTKVDDGKFIVKGLINEKAKTIDDINILAPYTSVTYIDLGNNQFSITSNKTQALDLLEDEGVTLFEDDPDIIDTSKEHLARGAIGRVYTHKNILSSTLISDNYDGTMDTGEGIVNRPSAFFNDLQGAPVWAPDFPNNGPINTFAKFNKSVSHILTMDISNIGNEDFWSITDTTKDPADWFETKDSQQLFNIKKEKGYWLNIKELIPNSLSIGQDVVYKLVSAPHFDNNWTTISSRQLSPVTNHINHDFSITVNGIDPLTNDSYNVSATIAGQEYPLRTSGTRFSLRINDWYMNLDETLEDVTSANRIILTIFDGLGNKLINTEHPVYFTKPVTPSATWDLDGNLVVTSKNPYQIHSSPILDTAPDASISLRDKSDIENIEKANWVNNDGNYTILRLVAKSKETNFYSDVQPIYYAPVKSGHVLNVEEKGDSDVLPYSYISKSILKVNGIESDGGVELSNLSDKRILLSYYPHDKEGVKNLSSFAGANTMYIKVDADIIGYITYIPSFNNKIFYVYYDKILYQGMFSPRNNYAYEGVAYDLETNIIPSNGFVASVQPIVEPSGVTKPSPGTGNTNNQNPQTGTNVPPAPQLLLPRN